MDVTDDSIRRFVVRHYRYDPERRERRHVVVQAFDTEAEFDALIRAITDDIRHRRAARAIGSTAASTRRASSMSPATASVQPRVTGCAG